MVEKDHVESHHFGNSSKIHGHLAHDKFPIGMLRWYIYSIDDVPCQLKIVGSTTNPTSRWRNYKSSCNSQNSNSTGLSKHFKSGCPNDTGREKTTLDFTLLDFLDTSHEKLALANHEPGPKCRCSECEKLKSLEDAWILKLGTFYERGLNTRDEVKTKSRCNWWFMFFVCHFCLRGGGGFSSTNTFFTGCSSCYSPSYQHSKNKYSFLEHPTQKSSNFSYFHQIMYLIISLRYRQSQKLAKLHPLFPLDLKKVSINRNVVLKLSICLIKEKISSF